MNITNHNMPIIEKFAKAQNEAELAKNPREQEIKGPTIKEILANKAQSELFGLYLQEEGPEGYELGLKLKAGELDRDEIADLNERRKGFLEIMERSKNTLEILGPAELAEIINATPELKDLAEVAGPESMRNAIARYLPKMAVLDRERFAILSEGAITLKERKQAIAEENKNIKKLCEEYDIDEDEYVKLMQSGSYDDLENLVKNKMSFWRKIFRRSSIADKVDEFDKASVIRGHIESLTNDMKGVGSALEMALMDNNVLREALIADFTKEGEAPKLEAGASFSETKRPNDKDIEAAWEEYSTTYDAGFGFRPEKGTDTQYQAAREEFSKQYTNKALNGKKGFWASISQAIWGSMIGDVVDRKVKK